MLFHQKGNNSKMGDNSDKKKQKGQLFFHEDPYMKFQNISIDDSKVKLCTKKQQH